MHNSDEIDENTRDLMKPAVVTFYNSTKGRVDILDGMREEYNNFARVAFSWPLQEGRLSKP